MTRPANPLEFNAWINSSGSADDSWPRPGKPLARIFELDSYLHVARVAHRGVFSNIFLSDRPQLVIDENTRPEQTFDPYVLLAAVLGQVPDIGGIVTASTTYSDPYTLARQMQSLNLLTKGRIGWNIVTSWHPAIAGNFSDAGLPDRKARYERAEEFVDVVLKLWESWQFPWGQEDGSYGSVQPIHHKGKHFSVAGPLNLPAAPWGRPLLLQAGGSASGMELAARHADYIYAPLGSLEGSIQFRNELRSAAEARGRPSTALPKVLPAISPVILSSEAEVADYLRDLRERDPVTDADLASAASLLGTQAGTDPDRRLVAEDFLASPNSVIPLGVIHAKRSKALDGGHSLRQFAAAEKEPEVIGTPRQIADFIIGWWQQGAVDGFTISGSYLPDDLELFVDTVVPVLQARGVYPRSYSEKALAA
jgi:FMN-dependent oxidoreductase (nitrilotriacetate monooxygenase family)